MHVEEVFPSEVVRRKFPKVDLVEPVFCGACVSSSTCTLRLARFCLHDGSGVVDVVETQRGGEQKDASEHSPIDLAPRGLDVLRGLSRMQIKSVSKVPSEQRGRVSPLDDGSTRAPLRAAVDACRDAPDR